MDQNSEPYHVAFLDMGTNSVRWMLVRINPNQSFSIVGKQKGTIRLGEGEFVNQTLQPDAMQRAVQVCKQFADLSRSRQAKEIFAVATSATREAENQAEFIQRLRTEAGLEVHVVSGQEEARLIYLGVSSSIHLEDRLALFLDIGGGSTEAIAGDQSQYYYLETHRLGAIRLASLFFLPDEATPVSADRYALIKNYVRNAIIRTVQHLKEYSFDRFIGSSGSIINLADVTSQYYSGKNMDRDRALPREQISEMIRRLCSLPLDERRKVPGINPERADIIIPGAAILETFMEELELDELRISERGLLDGLLVDYLDRNGHGQGLGGLSVREKSVLQLGRSLNFEEAHARTVSRLSLQLFDSAQEIGLHDLDRHDRELLEHAALLHDIGTFISYQNHQAHTSYLIQNATLLGFDQTEINLMAMIALFHRKGAPGPKAKELSGLDKSQREAIRMLSVFLRMAESLDRSHSGVVTSCRLVASSKKCVELEITSDQDCELELWGVKTTLESFQKTFGKEVGEVIRSPAPSSS
jgi:exopolyphosphatase/guanosine-5'-triphosphate,3'-diphosphate pyrophosphatase